MRLRRTGSVLALVLAFVGATEAPSANAARKSCRGTRTTVRGKETCLRVGQRCRRAERPEYLLVGLDCVRHRRRLLLRRASLAALRQGRVIALPRSGRPTFPEALWWFDKAVAPLPGVHVPPGAVGSDRDGTSAIKALSLYAKRLSPRQRGVLRGLLTPHPALTIDPSAPTVARTTLAAAPAGLGDLPPILAEALRRLKAHGVFFRHGISLEKLSANNSTEEAHTLATWLQGTGSVCAISIRPSLVRGSLLERRTAILHELIHCASAEQSASKLVWDSQPKYLDEGLPDWAAFRVSVEWQGRPGDTSFWPVYLSHPDLDVRTRSYDAVGLWSLFEHEGVDLYKLLPDLVHSGGGGDPAKPLAVALAAAPATTVADWGSTLATSAGLGARWNLDGPGMPGRPEPAQTIDDGSSWGRGVSAAGAYETRLDLRADVVRIRTGAGIKGWLRDGAGTDHELGADDRYCVREGGCTCPNGRDPTVDQIPDGEAHLGFADAERSKAVLVEGETLDKVCKAGPPSGIEVHREIGSQDVRVATFVSGKCTLKQKLFTATATAGAYMLTVRISAFKGYRQQYPLSYGVGDPGFVLTGPGGPWATANRPPVTLPISSAIVFDKSGTRLSLSFPAVDSSGHGGALLAGIMSCRKK